MNSPENISTAGDSTGTQETGLWLTKDVAQYLHVNVKTVFNLRKRGLPYVQLGGAVRFIPEEIKDYLRKNRGLAGHRLRQAVRKEVPR